MSKQTKKAFCIFSTCVSLFSAVWPFKVYAGAGKAKEFIDSLRCEEKASTAWLELQLFKSYDKVEGKKQPVLEIWEKTPQNSEQIKRFSQDDLSKLIYSAQGKKEIELFKIYFGEEDLKEAHGIPSSDGKAIEKVRFHVAWRTGGECSKTVNVL